MDEPLSRASSPAQAGHHPAPARETAPHPPGRPNAEPEHDTEVAIVGAGPYGLSISAHLSGADVAHEIFGVPMETWRRHMPVGMALKSEGFASFLSDPTGTYTLERFCREFGHGYERIGRPVRLEEFASYGEWFQQELVPQVRQERIEAIARSNGGFELTTSGGATLRARSVVLATGVQRHAYLPDELAGAPGDKVAHTYDAVDIPAYRGSDVIVVGAGQSALEAAVLLNEAGANVRLLARAREIMWGARPGGLERRLLERMRNPESGLGEGPHQWAYSNLALQFTLAPRGTRFARGYGALGPAGSWWLRDRFDGHVEALLGRRIVGHDLPGERIRLRVVGPAGAEDLEADRVVAGTGYRPTIDAFFFLSSELRDGMKTYRGTPALNRSFETSVPGLHVVGYPTASTFGPLMRFVFGTDFAARRIARALTATRRSPQRRLSTRPS